MSDEYIKREKLLIDMHNSHSVPLFIGHKTDEDIMFCQMLDIVKEQPVADVVEVVHGEWVEKHWYKRGDCYYTKNCSCCNCAVKPKYTYNFCPNCGAKMDGENNGNG